MKILAFDIATRTGVAFGSAGETPRTTSIDFGKKLPDAERFAKMLNATRKLILRLRPDLVVYEAAIGGPRTSHFLVGIAACMAGQASAMGHTPKGVSLGAIRAHFIGRNVTSKDFIQIVRYENRTKKMTEKQLAAKAKALARAEIKRMTIARCFALGWPVKGDDEADACALWSYASTTFAGVQAAPLGGLFND